MRMSAAPVSRVSRFKSARICAWTVTSSAVVGSSATISSGAIASDIAIITRWRMPPEYWWGYEDEAARRVGDRHPAEQRGDLARGLLPRRAAVRVDGLAHLHAHREHRIERRHRLLEDHRDAVAADGADALVVERQEVGALEVDRAAVEVARRLRHQAEDRERGHALARAALADDGERLAG